MKNSNHKKAVLEMKIQLYVLEKRLHEVFRILEHLC